MQANAQTYTHTELKRVAFIRKPKLYCTWAIHLTCLAYGNNMMQRGAVVAYACWKETASSSYAASQAANCQRHEMRYAPSRLVGRCKLIAGGRWWRWKRVWQLLQHTRTHTQARALSLRQVPIRFVGCDSGGKAVWHMSAQPFPSCHGGCQSNNNCQVWHAEWGYERNMLRVNKFIQILFVHKSLLSAAASGTWAARTKGRNS